MNSKKFILSVIAYFVITFAAAYPWHIIWFHDLYVEWGAMQRTEPLIGFGVLAIFIQGMVIAYLYPFFYNKNAGNPIFQGVKFTLIIGLMTYTAMAFAPVAKYNIDPIVPFLTFQTIFQLIQFVLTGAAIGYIFKEDS